MKYDYVHQSPMLHSIKELGQVCQQYSPQREIDGALEVYNEILDAMKWEK